METIVILLDPSKLDNPDLDLRYLIPERLEALSQGAIKDNGYDYIDTEPGQPGPLMGIWLSCAKAEESWPLVLELFRQEKILGNDLSQSARIYISPEDCAEPEACRLVYPED